MLGDKCLELRFNKFPDLRSHKFLKVADATVLAFLFFELIVDFLPTAALVAIDIVEVVKAVALGIFGLDFLDFLAKTAGMGREMGTGGYTLLP